MDLRPLGDEELLARLDALVGEERERIADVVAHLMEVDRRDLAKDKAYPSLFHYCTGKLKYSEQAAFARIRAARAAQKFPEVLTKLRDGSLHLEAVMRLYPVLTEENRERVLQQADGASKRKVLEMVADLKGPDVPKLDRAVPLSTTMLRVNTLQIEAREPAAIVPLPRRVRFEFEADDGLLLKIERLRGLLRHKYPFARFEDLFSEAAEALLDKIDPDRKPPASERRGRSKNGVSRTRRVPESVKREVWQRDGGRCAFVAPDGRRCESVDALQYDHVTPYALGGASDDPANIRLLCRPHNQRLARKRFGPRPPKASGP